MKKKSFIAILCVLFTAMFSGCINNNKIITKTTLKMDTVFQLKAYGPKANEAIDASFKRLDEIEQMASTTIETSDISEINKEAGISEVKVHPEIIQMVKTGVEYSKLSNGAFDITVGPLVNLWGIGTDNERLPLDSEIQKKLPLVGYENISINEENSTIKLLKEGMSIDLGGIAKGFAADEVVKIFKDYNIKGGIISLGGSSIYTVGNKEDGTPWNVGIKHPREDDNTVYAGVLNLSEKALATSGDYERYFIKDGKRYHHIMNPKTGYPADSGIISVTVLVDNDVLNPNMIADTLTKVVFVSGVNKGFEFIDGIKGVSAMAITSDYKIYKSSNWNTKIDKLDKDFTLEN